MTTGRLRRPRTTCRRICAPPPLTRDHGGRSYIERTFPTIGWLSDGLDDELVQRIRRARQTCSTTKIRATGAPSVRGRASCGRYGTQAKAHDAARGFAERSGGGEVRDHREDNNRIWNTDTVVTLLSAARCNAVHRVPARWRKGEELLAALVARRDVHPSLLKQRTESTRKLVTANT